MGSLTIQYILVAVAVLSLVATATTLLLNTRSTKLRFLYDEIARLQVVVRQQQTAIHEAEAKVERLQQRVAELETQNIALMQQLTLRTPQRPIRK